MEGKVEVDHKETGINTSVIESSRVKSCYVNTQGACTYKVGIVMHSPYI